MKKEIRNLEALYAKHEIKVTTPISTKSTFWRNLWWGLEPIATVIGFIGFALLCWAVFWAGAIWC